MENLQEIIKEFFEKIELEKIDTININYYFFQKYRKSSCKIKFLCYNTISSKRTKHLK